MFSEKELSLQERRLKAFSKFLGYGREDATIVAIGSEEGLPSNEATIDERIEKYMHGDYWLESNNETPPNIIGVEGFIVNLLKKLKERKINGFENIDPVNNYNAVVHNMNIIPIGCKSEGKAENAYENIFGISHIKLREHYELDKNRIEIIKKFINFKISQKEKPLIVVMGNVAGKYFLDNNIISSPDSCQYKDWRKGRKNKSPLNWSSDKLVWLMGHPSHGWTDEEVIDKMMELKSNA
jgi:hypothetical protein